MKKTDLNRRDFHRLSMAAFGGVVAGSLAGCGGGGDGNGGGDGTGAGDGSGGGGGDGTRGGDDGTGGGEEAPTEGVALLMAEPHVCRGLNTCENKGASGENQCAGQGTCAAESLHHDCATLNACKGQGGCGEEPGMNACEGKGGCHVPLMEDAWKTAREAFETAMADAGKAVGEAPAE